MNPTLSQFDPPQYSNLKFTSAFDMPSLPVYADVCHSNNGNNNNNMNNLLINSDTDLLNFPNKSLSSNDPPSYSELLSLGLIQINPTSRSDPVSLSPIGSDHNGNDQDPDQTKLSD